MQSFPCDKCGLCCTRLGNSSLYQSLDRGDGTCVNFDAENKLCLIYKERPDICKVDAMYELKFKGSMSRIDFYRLNQIACQEIKNFENTKRN
ncbi:YkgJ family cysteine cluster protein [Shewanella insulae]|uniref:YkgJ family cysteine cluster protein n=1 Tax=Shewanella insulae TaxID=2681496 RepID=UPI003CE4A646